MLASAHNKFIVLLVGLPKGVDADTIVPCPVIEGKEGVRVFDTYEQANKFKAECKASYPLYWYSVAKVNIPPKDRV